VFAGGFTLDAAESVVAGDPVEAVEVLDVLLALVDKSFVVAAHDTGRYSTLETLRQYGAARLFEAEETEGVRDRHLAWAAGLFDIVRLRTTGDFRHIGEASLEIDNLRSAFEWATTTENADAACVLASTLMIWEGDLGDATEAVRVGLRAIGLSATQLRLHLLIRSLLVMAYFEIGEFDASAAMCDTVRELLTELDETDPVRITCLRMSAFSAKHAADHGAALRGALELAERAELPEAVAVCASMLATGAAWRGDVATADRFMMRATTDSETVSGRNVLTCRGLVAIVSGRFDEARAVIDEHAMLYRDRHPRLVVHVEAQRVFVDLAQGVDTGAATRVAELLVDARHRRFLSGVASAGWAPGAWALAYGNIDRALEELLAWRSEQSSAFALGRQWLGILVHALLASGMVDEAAAALSNAREHENRHNLGLDIAAVRRTALDGLVARAEGDLGRAEQCTHEALAMQHEQGWRPDLVHSIEALAGIASANESYTEAVRLAAAAQRLRDEMGYVLRWPYEQQLLDADLAAARTVLGREACDAAWAEGLALDETAVVGYAQRARGERKRPSVGWESLTPVEGEVVRLVAEGLTNRQVGDALFIGAETVKTHLSHVYDKLGVRSRTALAAQFSERNESSAVRS
jgi:DNA-binding CsgD family transcriptional regulator